MNAMVEQQFLVPGMNVSKMVITPETAKRLLDGNSDNRKLIRSTVDQYARDMAAGRWRLTHQGLLIGKRGKILDGQHRLHAIVKSGVSQPMLVAIDNTLSDTHALPVDVGMKRSGAYVAGITTNNHAICGSYLQLARGTSKQSTAEIVEVYEALQPYIIRAIKAKKHGRATAKAPICLAAITQVILGKDEDYVSGLFSDLSAHRFTNLDPYPASFFRQIALDRITLPPTQLFTRALKVFDPANRMKTHCKVVDEKAAWEQAKHALLAAGQKVGLE